MIDVTAVYFKHFCVTALRYRVNMCAFQTCTGIIRQSISLDNILIDSRLTCSRVTGVPCRFTEIYNCQFLSCVQRVIVIGAVPTDKCNDCRLISSCNSTLARGVIAILLFVDYSLKQLNHMYMQLTLLLLLSLLTVRII